MAGHPKLSVEGLVVVLTGGGTGLGRSTALALAENGAAKVFILGRREEVLQETRVFKQERHNHSSSGGYHVERIFASSL
ncbi:hypothetical protein AnigIFM50267_008710 [Aspergillus niger]|nr:hypothetical protein AnigIFM50267_008710 [Aspergillus niger]